MHFLHIAFLFQFSLISLWMWRYFTDWSLWNRLDNCLRFNQTVSSFIFISIRSNNSSDWYSIISFFILFYIFRNTPDSIVTIWLRLHFVSWTYILFILLLLKFIVSKIVKLHIVIALMLRILSWIRSYSFIFIFMTNWFLIKQYLYLIFLNAQTHHYHAPSICAFIRLLTWTNTEILLFYI